MEARNSHPIADNRSDSFARTSHFTKESEIAINEQINIEYNVSYIYHAMYAYFARDNVYLPGIAQHFALASERTVVSDAPIIAFLDHHLKGAAAAPLAEVAAVFEQKAK